MALSGKKLLLLGFVVVLMVVIPLTVYLVQQQQKLKVGATPATTLSLIDQTTKTAAASTTVGQNVNFDVTMNPGTNQISFVKLTITYDSTKLATAGAGLAPNTTAFPTTLQGPIYTPNSVSVTLSVGSNPQNIISSTTRVATLTLKALDVTTTPSQVAFGPDTQVLSIASSDQFNENVLSSWTPGTVTIAQGTATPTPTTTPSTTPTSSPAPTPKASTAPTPTPAAGTGGVSATPCPAGSSTCQVATVPSPLASASATPFSTPTPVPTPRPTLAPTGPGNTIFSLGTLGIVSAIAGVILLFAL